MVLLEHVEGALALGLVLVAVDGFGLDAALDQVVLLEPLDAVLGAAKDEHAGEIALRQELMEHVQFVAGADADDVLVDAFRQYRPVFTEIETGSRRKSLIRTLMSRDIVAEKKSV